MPRLANTLAKRGIVPEVGDVWADALASGSLYRALLQLDLLESAGVDREQRLPCPDWLVLALPALLTDPSEATYLAGLFFTPAFRNMAPPNQGLFIARAIQFFIRCRHFIAAREAVEFLCFHRPPGLDNTRTFARCLQALTKDHSRPGSASAPPPDLLKSLAATLRTTMAARNILPTLEVFRPLFSVPLIPQEPEDARALLAEVAVAKLEPPKEFLHTVMKIYATKGKVTEAGKIRDQIYRMARDEKAAARADGMVSSRPDDAPGDEFADLAVDTEDRLDELNISTKVETTYLRSLIDRPDEALELFERLRSHVVAQGREPDIRPVWPVLFYVLARSHRVSAVELIEMLRRLESAAAGVRNSTSKPTVRIYTLVLQGLIRRREYERATALWRQIRRTGLRPDVTLLTVVTTAYAHSGDLARAEQTLRQYGEPPVDMPRRTSLKENRRRIPFDAVPLNVLMAAYSREGRYSAAYALFRRFASHGVRPNAATISILLDTARYASADSGRGFGPGDEALPVHQGGHAPVADRWDGDEAWHRAERIVWSILHENWPDAARTIRDPRSSAPLDRLRTFASRAFGFAAASSPADTTPRSDAFATTLSPNEMHFAQIHPSERMFRSFIQLLGYHSTSESIPRVLAWMRHLDVPPERETLILAVLYIDEGAPSDSQRRRLADWIDDWLGPGSAPTDDELAAKRRGGGRPSLSPFN